jgi:hypothetical protein
MHATLHHERKQSSLTDGWMADAWIADEFADGRLVGMPNNCQSFL